MNVKMKGRTYEAFVRPAMLHCRETSAVIKGSEENKLNIAEMKMPRLICGVQEDCRRNDLVRGTSKI